MRPAGAARAPRLVLAAGFAAAIGAPLALLAAHGAEPSTAMLERRMPAPPARAPRNVDEALAWPRKFDAWWADHFPLRGELLAAHNRVVWSAFGDSPSQLEHRGLDGWLFPTANRGLDVARGAFPFLPHRLDGWKRMLRERERVLAERGIVYLFAPIPNKDQVYPERLSAPWDERGETRVQQLVAAMGADSPVLDLRAALLEEKRRDGELGPDDLTFYRYGAHWTDRGAYAGYSAIVERLRERGVRAEIAPREVFAVDARGTGDTSAPSMYLGELLEQTAWRWSARDRSNVNYDEATVDDEREWEHSRDAPHLDGLVVFHDSFGPYLRRFWAESFGSVGSYWASFDLEIIEERQPRAVVDLFVDRVLVHTPPEPRAFEPAGVRIADFERLPNAGISARPLRRSTALRGVDETTLEDVDDGVRVNAQRGLPTVELRIETGEGLAGPHVALEVTAPRAAFVDVFYRTRREPGLERHNIASTALGAGRTRVVIEICDDQVVGPLQLRFPPAKQAGYVLHALEIRSR